ncbi:hypothetical protein NUW58_g5996 [Xylaria curta]|uniref:Uncharacterized protein n=1 Tax=Xylaria curta TaxID=42375 RepID=A0ACC1P1K6_9PEZI|nr:hypothetical protein NUW58_g5996 [Xylaria curta]
MEQSQSGKIRYTIQYHSSIPGRIPTAHPVHTVSQNEPPPELRRAHQKDGTIPVIEIVMAVDAISEGDVGSTSNILHHHVTSIRSTYMIIHSEALSQTIRDVVQFYAGQNLTGTNLIIHEPYACLMHHMTDLEHVVASDPDLTKSEHLQILMEFLRPRYHQHYTPAKARSLSVQPTAMFDDLWVVMKPGSLAYTSWNDHKIGCVIGKSIRLPPDPDDDLLERWEIDFWFLQVHWPSDQIGCTIKTAVIDRFDGEKPITSLPIYPTEFHDAKDQGRTKQRFIDRGKKVSEIFWGESMYMEYDGECMDHAKESYKGRIIVGGAYDDAVYPKHSWQFSFAPPTELMKNDPDVPVSQIELMVNPKTDHIFIRALMSFEGVAFLTTGPVGIIDDSFYSLISLTVSLDDKTRNLIWLGLEKSLNAQEGIQLHQSATKFLASSEARVVDWDDNEMTRCFKIAIALATNQTNHAEKDMVVVEDGHFKEAMNIIHGSRRFSPRGINQPGPLPRPIYFRRPLDVDSSEDSSSSSDETDAGHPKPPRENLSIKPLTEIPQHPLNLSSDSDLCIPDFNRVEWEAFQAAGGEELFRKTKFHAIDVLKGEPLIKLKDDDRKRRRRQKSAQKIVSSGSTVPDAVSHGRQVSKESEPSSAPLAERIRINSPAIIRAFAEICGEEISAPFLLFRPFRSLLYYEQEFRDLISQQENMLQEWSTPNTQTDENSENETERRVALARSEQMKCLISFIDDEIKKKKEYLMSSHCQSIPFADIPMLFSTGEAAISKDYKQVYRIIKVSCTRHRVKKRKEKTRLNFLKDESGVELEDDPVFVHCIYLDFDGKVMGPMSCIFMIQKYDGEKEVTSLPVFPLQHAKEDGLYEKLVKRGKLFFKVVGVKHMHYTGLTLKTRDDIDSQVVIDFEEAINRHPDWKPPIASVLEESSENFADPSEEPEDPVLRGFLKAKNSMRKACIKECCAREAKLLDEDVEDRRKEDYIVSQIKRATPTRLPVTIVPHDFRDIVGNNTLTDDDYLIMSYRVFGFVLRSRKWHELDMTHVFEVAALGAGEGFDELVLPAGHGDMVKSMIRQHLRDRNLSLINRDKTDVVRGKGRGLIILLHGVPGVGKTSTAGQLDQLFDYILEALADEYLPECVADLFRRPLFQITSGDLGTTAREVEDALEENFSLASRWNSILLIDEADVFLAERTKEDFVRNSLVAVFLRMMEYYAGVLFLTTNRVGVFDEAFTSRVHISLYYPPLDRKSTLQIFQKNWDRINTRYKEAGRVIDIDTAEITEFAIDYFENNREGRWNGRQIRNAFQSALALAELDASGTDDFLDESDNNRPVVLGRKSFDTVAKAYKGFIDYLKQNSQ